MGTVPDQHRPPRAAAGRRSAWVGALIGVGTMAAIDEIVFHQILAWHHFYDRSTPQVGLMTDGLLHAAELVMLVAGIFLVADLARRGTLATGHAWAGLLLGAGGFQVFDGLVNHKVLRLHQVRYGVDNLPAYDAAWVGAGLILVAAGLTVLFRARRTRAGTDEPGPGVAR